MYTVISTPEYLRRVHEVPNLGMKAHGNFDDPKKALAFVFGENWSEKPVWAKLKLPMDDNPCTHLCSTGGRDFWLVKHIEL